MPNSHALQNVLLCNVYTDKMLVDCMNPVRQFIAKSSIILAMSENMKSGKGLPKSSKASFTLIANDTVTASANSTNFRLGCNKLPFGFFNFCGRHTLGVQVQI